jgi:hypothetical protein
MKNRFIFCLLLGFSLNIYCIEIRYTLLNGTVGNFNVPNDIVEFNARKGNINFIRSNGEIINFKGILSPMTEIFGLENLPILNRIELALQLHCDNLLFLKSSSVEYLLIYMEVDLNNLDFLINFPNLKYLGFEGIKYKNNITDIRKTRIKYFIVSHVKYDGNIILKQDGALEEFICFYSDIVLDSDRNIKIINNYNDFVNEPKYFKLFDW